MTLDGTNTYVTAGWVVDPGPADPPHLQAVLAAARGEISGIVLTHGPPHLQAVLAAAGGEISGIVLTHSHPDHAEGAAPLAELSGAPVVRPSEGDEVGPFLALATPGHSADHVALLRGRACFTGDTVLGAGSVFIAPGEGSMSAYLDSLRRLRELDLDVLCPGHGPYVWDPRAKLDEYIAHRLDREQRLLAALADGLRGTNELLDRAWSDAPAELRPAAALTLEAHLEKLAEEGRLPQS